MPRETIRRLSHHVDQLLVAGAHLAVANPDLAKDQAALDQLSAKLGAKAPAITAIAGATAKVLGAKPNEAAKELVSLATMASQIRAAQAQPAAVPATTPLAQRPLIGTPCNAKDLSAISAALTTKAKGRQEVVERFIASGDIADLRLVDAVIHAMADSYLGDLVVDQAMPRLGASVVAPLRASLARMDPAKARSLDGKRLRALVAVQKNGARDLLLNALRNGNADLREAAFDAIADHIRGVAEFEPLVLATIDKERAGNVRRAAIRALAGYGSDASLAATIAALEDSRTIAPSVEALSQSTHPAVVDRLLERLAELVDGAAAEKKSRKKAAPPGATPTTAAPAKKTNEVETSGRIRALLTALAGHRDPRIADAAMPLLKYGEPAAAAVVASGTPAQRSEIAGLLAGNNRDLFEIAAKAMGTLDPDTAFAGLSAPFIADDAGTVVGQARLDATGEQIVRMADPRWKDWALAHLDRVLSPGTGIRRDDGDLAPQILQHVVPIIAAHVDQRAVSSLIQLLNLTKHTQLLHHCVDALGKLGDPTAIDPLLAFRTRNDWQLTWAIREAILAINHRSSVEKVRAIVAGVNRESYDTWHLTSLLDQLERRFPGA